MWANIVIKDLEIGKVYLVMDSHRCVVGATFEGDCFRNSVTKDIITNPARVWQ